MTDFNDDPEGPSGHVSPVAQAASEWCFTVMTASGLPVATFCFPTAKEANTYVGVMEELIRHAKAIMKPADDAAGWVTPPIVR